VRLVNAVRVPDDDDVSAVIDVRTYRAPSREDDLEFVWLRGFPDHASSGVGA
jgi:hypothetical protein